MRKTDAVTEGRTVNRDRCYLILSKDGSETIRLRSGKRPDARTIEALQNLFDAAKKHLAALSDQHGVEAAGSDKPKD